LITTILMASTHAQIKPPLAIDEYKEGIYGGITPEEEIRLFDLNEIKKREIDTAYIIFHPSSWEGEYPNECSYNDTLKLYRFDSEGRIIQSTSFQDLGNYSTTFHFDSLGNTISRVMYSKEGSNPGTRTYPTQYDTTNYKYIIKRTKVGRDSILTKISLWRFKTGLDTAYIVKKVINQRGQLIEISSASNKKYELEIFDDSGELTYHYKYDYDDKGRLIYYQAFGSGYYERTSYPFYGKLLERYNDKTNILEERQVKLISENKGVITVTTDKSQVVLTPLEKGSKLYKLKTIISIGEFPLIGYYEIKYK
jgi:hypothetical protein